MNKNRPTVPPLSPALQQTFHKVSALREYTRKSGFRTTRSEKELLAPLRAEDLAALLIALSCEHLHFRLEGLPCGNKDCLGSTEGGYVAICEDCGAVDRRDENGDGSFTKRNEGGAQ